MSFCFVVSLRKQYVTWFYTRACTAAARQNRSRAHLETRLIRREQRSATRSSIATVVKQANNSHQSVDSTSHGTHTKKQLNDAQSK